MKLIRFGEPGKEKPGVIINDEYWDVSSFINEYDEKFFEGDGFAFLQQIITSTKLEPVPKHTRLGPPIARPSKIICIGLNYSDHAAESRPLLLICDADVDEPVFNFKTFVRHD